MTRKTIVIVGATGKQGSAVTKLFLGLPRWSIRCVTRSRSTPAAATLSSLGADLHEADLSDKNSLEKAFAGSHAIFLNTDFWTPYRRSIGVGKSNSVACIEAYDIEVQWGRNAIEAASNVPTLERLVYSALPSMKAVGGEKYSSGLHWESKATIIKDIEEQHPALFAKTSLIYVGAYSHNAFFRPQRNGTDEYVAYLPATQTTVCPVINPSGPAIGGFVRALLEDEPAGTKLLAFDEQITFEHAYDCWTKLTGKQYRCVESTVEDVHAITGVPLEVLQPAAFIAEYGFAAGVESVVEPWQLSHKIVSQTYEEYLKGWSVQDLLVTSDESMVTSFTK